MKKFFSTAKRSKPGKGIDRMRNERRDRGIVTVAMLDAFVLGSITGQDVKILLSYIK